MDNLTDQLYGISVIGSTLQIDTTTNDKYGFAVASDAKTVLIQDSETRSGKWTMMDDIYEYTGGSDGLERAVRNLNDNDEFKGFIGAVFTNGLATSIVIYDKTETDINTGIDTPQSTDYEMVAGSGRNYFTDAQIWAPNDDSTFSGTVAQTRALNALANGIMEAGYKVTRIDTSAWSVTYEDGDASITVHLSDVDKVLRVNYDGKTEYMLGDATEKIGTAATADWRITSWRGNYVQIDGVQYEDVSDSSHPGWADGLTVAWSWDHDNDGVVDLVDGYYALGNIDTTISGWTVQTHTAM